MMDWLPLPPAFRDQLRAAAALADPQARWQALCVLAGLRLNPVELMQLDRELSRLRPLLGAAVVPLRLALLSDATADHLAPALRVAALRRGLLLDVHVGGFGQARAELLEPGSPLQAFAPEFVVLSFGTREALGGVDIGADAETCRQATERAIADLAPLWQAAREHFGATVIQQNYVDTADRLFGSLDAIVPAAPARRVAALNARLADACADAGVTLLDLAHTVARDGLAAWFDRGRWLQAKMAIAPTAAAAYGEQVLRLVGAHRGRSRKCLVLDLDNTLWGGVIGDDGLEGIRIGEGSAVGEAHLQLQRHAKALAARGVILAVCSKNEHATALRAFREHPEMALREADIAAFAINWEDKAANLRRIAEQLNIGLDSLVFVDDNPAERERVRAALPMVAVPELPPDPALYVDCLASAGYFEAVAFTAEDRARGQQYADQARRAELRAAAQSMGDFLSGLAMETAYGPVGPLEVERVTQLVNKTNQFNTTTRRLTADEVRAYAAGPESLALQFRLVDRLGDNGLVSAIFLAPVAGDPRALAIDNWVMSCRVFGREFEFEIMNIVVETARARGIETLHARFVPTERNGVVAGLYASLGFEPEGDADASAPSSWRLAIARYPARTTHIRRKSPT